MKVLVLDGAMQPLHVIPIKKAITLLVTGKAVPASDETLAVVHTESMSYNVPSIIRVFAVVAHLLHRKAPAVTRRKILIRDQHECQFIVDGQACIVKATTIDHLIPRSKGGKDTWENLVASCQKHNAAKEDRDFAELEERRHWRLRNKPVAPRFQIQALADRKIRRPEWTPYIQAVI